MSIPFFGQFEVNVWYFERLPSERKFDLVLATGKPMHSMTYAGLVRSKSYFRSFLPLGPNRNQEASV
jgi:hypothetical protein